MQYFYIDLDVESDERFDFAKFSNYNTDNYDILLSYFYEELKKLPDTGVYIVVDDEYRPDLISDRIYGDTQYWWMLLAYNSILDFETIVAGDKIKFPSLSDVEELFFSLKGLESASS